MIWGLFSHLASQNYNFFMDNFVALIDNLYLCNEMDEWWGLIKPFFCS